MKRFATIAITLFLLSALGATSLFAQFTATSRASGNYNADATWLLSRTGTITTSTASAAVVGTGTLFTTELVDGDVLYTSGDVLIGTVNTGGITTATDLTLTGNAGVTLTTQPFYIRKAPVATNNVVLANGFVVTLTGAVTRTSPGTFTIQSGGVLECGTFVISGNGSFTLGAGGEIRIGHADGIDASGVGNIQVTGARTFDTGANYTYNGAVNQQTGDEFDGAAILTIANTGAGGNNTVTLTNGFVTASAALVVNSGIFDLSTNAVSGNSTGTLNVSNGATIRTGYSTTDAGYLQLFASRTWGATSTLEIYSTATPFAFHAGTYGHLIIAGASGQKSPQGAVVVAGNLTISSSTLDILGQNFSVAGTSSISGTFKDNFSSGTVSFTGLVTINAGGTWNNNGDAAITFKGGITNNSANAHTFGAGTQTFDTNAQSLSGTNAITIQNTTVTGVTLTNNGTFNSTATLAGTGTFSNGATGTLTINYASAPTITTFLVDVAGNTVNYNGTAQTVRAVTYDNLTLSNSGAKTLTGLLAVNGTLTLSGTATATAPGDLDLGGVSIGAGTTLTAGANTLNVLGNWSNSGTFVNTGSTIEFEGSTAQTITGTTTFNNLSINNSHATDKVDASGATALTVNGLLRVLDGQFKSKSDYVDVQVDALATLELSGNITVSGNWTVAATGILTPGTFTVTFDGGAGQSITSGGTSFYDVVINKVGTATLQDAFTATNNFTLTAGTFSTGTNQQVTVGNDVTLTAGTFTANASSIYLTGGDWIDNAAGDIFTENTSSVKLVSGGVQSIQSATATTQTFANLYIGFTTDASVGGSTTTLTLTGAFTMETDAMFSAPAQLNLAGDWTNLGDFTHNDGTVTFNGTTEILGGSEIVFFNVTIAASSTLTAPLNANMVVQGDFTNNGTFLRNGGTVTFTGATAKQIIGSAAFHNLTIDKGAGTITLAASSATSVVNGLTLTTGGLLTGANQITVGDATAGEQGSFITVNSVLTIQTGGSVTQTTDELVELTVGAAGTLLTATTFPSVTGTISLNAASTVEYNAAGVQTVSAQSYGNLTLSTSGLKQAGGSITINSTTTINGTASLDPLAQTVILNGDLVSNSTGGMASGGAGTVQFNGSTTISGTSTLHTFFNVTITGTGTLVDGGTTLSVSGAWTNSGTFTPTGLVKFAFTGNINASNFNHIEINAGVSRTAMGALDINGNVTINGTGTLDASTFSHTVAGHWTNNGTFTASSSTITFDGSGVQNIGPTSTFNNLTIANTGTGGTTDSVKAIGLTVNGNLAVNDGKFSTASDFNGNITIAAGAEFSLNGNATVAGNWTNNWIFQHNGYTITFDGGNAQTINTGGTAGGKQFYNVVVNKSGDTATLGNNIQIDNDFTLTLGGFNTGGMNVTVGGNFATTAGTFTANGSTIIVSGNWTKSVGSTFLGGTSTVTLNSGGTARTISHLGNFPFYNLNVNPTLPANYTFLTSSDVSVAFTVGANANVFTGVNTITVGDPNGGEQGSILTVNGTLNIETLGSIAQSAAELVELTMSATGTIKTVTTFPALTGTVTLNAASTVEYNAAGNQNVSGQNYGNLTLSTSGTKSAVGTVTANGTLTISGTASFDAVAQQVYLVGNVVNNGGYTSSSTSITQFNGTTTLSGSGTFQFHEVVIEATSSLTDGGKTLLVSGGWFNDGTLTATGTVTFNGTALQEVDAGGTGATKAFYNFTVNNTGTVRLITNDMQAANNFTLTAGSFNTNDGTAFDFNVDVDGNVVLTAGTFTANTSTITVAGNWTNTATFTAGTSTVDFNGTSGNIGASNFNNLTVSAGSYTATAALDVNGAFSITGTATFVGGAFTHTVAGDWTKAGGATFTATGTTINFDGTGNVGASNFNNLTVSSGTRTATGSLDVNGNLDLSGTATFVGGAYTHTVAGNWTKAGGAAFTATGTTIDFDGAGNVGASNFNNFTVSSGTRTATGALDINGNVGIGGTGQFDLTAGGSHTVAGNWTNNATGSLAAGTSTVTFDGTSLVNNPLANGAFNHFTVLGGTVTIGADLPVAGNFTLTSGSFITSDLSLNYNMDVNGNMVLTAGSIEFATASNVTLGGNLTNNLGGGDTFTASASTLTFDGTGTQTLGGSAATAQYVLGNVVVNGTANTLDIQTDNARVEGDLTVTNGTLELNANHLDQNTATSNTFTLSAGTTLLVGGTSNFPAGFTTYTVDASTVNYDGAAQNITGSITYGNLTLSGSNTKTAAGAFTVAATLTINSGITLAGGGFNLNAGGNIVNAGVHTGTGKIRLIGGSATHVLFGTGSYTNLDLVDDESPAAQMLGSFSINGTLTLTTGNFSVSGNTLTLNGNPDVSGTGTLVASPGTVVYAQVGDGQDVFATQYGNLTFTNDGKDLNAGTIQVFGTFTPNADPDNIVMGSTFNFNNGGAQPVPAFEYGNLTVSGGNTKTLAAGTVIVHGDLTKALGTTLAANGSNTLQFGATASPPVNHNFFADGMVTINDLDIQCGGGSVTLANNGSAFTDLTVGNLNVENSGVPFIFGTANARTVNVGGDLTGGGSIDMNSAFAHVLNLDGATNSLTGSIVSNSGPGTTVNYTRAGNQTFVTTNYHHLTLGGSGTKTFADVTPEQLTVNGNFSILAGVILSMPEANKELSVIGNANNAGQQTGLGVVKLNSGLSDQNITGGGSYSFLNVWTINRADMLDDLTVTGGLTLTFGTLDVNTFTLTLGGLVLINSGSGFLTSDVTGTVDYNSAGAQTVIEGTYGNLTISGSRTTNSVTLQGSGTIGVANVFSPTATFSTGGYIVTGSTVNYNFAGAQNVALFNYNNLTFSNDGVKTFATGTTKIAGTLSIGGTASGDATTNAPTTIEYNGAAQPVNGSLTYHHLTLSGSSTKTAGGNITANGLLTVSAVTFSLDSWAATVGSLTGDGIINNGVGTPTLTVGSDNTSTTYSGVIGGAQTSFGLRKVGTGSLTLSGNNAYSVGTTISAGTILVQNTNALGTGAVTLNDASTAANNTSLLIDAGLLDGLGPANNIIVANQGSGVTSIGSTVNVAPFGVTYNGTLTLNKATTLADGSADQAKRTTFAGKISGNVGTLTVTGAGRVAFFMGVANDFVGDVVTAGTILFQTSSEFDHIPNASGVQVTAGTAWQLTTVGGSAVVGTETFNNLTGAGLVRAIAVGLGTGVVLEVGSAGGSSTYSGVMQNFTSNFALTKVGAGTFTISGVNTYTGTTTINAGVLQLGAAGVIADASAVVLADVASAVFDLNDFNETIANLSGGGATGGNIDLGSGTLTVTQTTEQNYSGIISGSGGLTKVGANRLKLFGANTYTGATAVNVGQLNLRNNTATGTTAGGVTVASGATLELEGGVTVGAEALSINGNGGSSGAVRNTSGANTWGGTVTVASDAEIQVDAGSLTLNAGTAITGTNTALTFDCISGDASITGTVNIGTGALTKTGSGMLSLGTAAVGVGDVTISAGTLVSTSGTMSAAGNWSNSATFTHNSGTVDFTGTGTPNTLNSGGNSFFNVIHSGAGTLQLVTNALTVGGAFTNSAGNYDANALVTTVTGQTTVSGGQYIASSAQQNFEAGLDVTGATASFLGSTGNVVVTGMVRILAGATLTGPGSGNFVSLTDDWVVQSGSTFTHNNGEVRFVGGITQEMVTDGDSFYDLIINKSADKVQVNVNPVNVANDFDLLSGTFDPRTNDLAVTVGNLTSVSGASAVYQVPATATQTFNVGGLVINAGNFTGFTTGNVNAASVYIDGGTLTALSSGSFLVRGDWTFESGTFTHNGGTITFEDGAGNIGGAATSTFNNLTIDPAALDIVSLDSNIGIVSDLSVLTGTFDLNDKTADRTAAGGTMTVAGTAKLLVGGADNFPENFGTVTLQNGSLVVFDRGGLTQDMTPPSPALSYSNVNLINGGTKSLNNSATVRGTLMIDATSTLSVPGANTLTMDATSTLDNGNGGTITNAGTINSASPTSETGNYNGAGTLTFDAGAAAQAIDFGAGKTFTSTGLTQLDGTGAITITGTTTPTFDDLDINNSNAAGITASSNWTATGIITLNNNDLDMNANTLTLTSTGTVANPVAGAAYDVLGRVRRPNGSMVAGTPYAFNNQYTTMTFSNAAPYGGIPNSDVVVNLSTGTAPTPMQTGTAIERLYSITSDGSTVDPDVPFRAALRLHYQDAELDVNTASELSLWRYEKPSPSAAAVYISKDRTGTVDETDKWAELDNVQLYSNWTLADVHTIHTHTWSGLASTDWTSPSNWINGIPHAQDIIVVQTNSPFYPVVPDGQLVEATSITVESGAQMTVLNNTTFDVTGDFTVINTGMLTIGNNNQLNLNGSLSTAGPIVLGNNNVLNIAGNVSVTAGSFQLGNTNTINLMGNWSNTVLVNATGVNNTVHLNGSVLQTMSGLLGFQILNIDNAAGVTVNNNMTIVTQLLLTEGIVKTNANIITITNPATVLRTNGHVNGFMRRDFVVGAQAFNFDIGDATYYTPVSLSFSTVEAAGNVTANTIAGDHTELDSAGLRAGRLVHRYWHLVPSGAFDYDFYSISLTFDPADADAAGKTQYFVVRRYNDTLWSPTVNGVRTATSTQGTNVNGMSDFAVGQQRPEKLRLADGDKQGGVIGNQLPNPFVVDVLDKFDLNTPDQLVTWGFSSYPENALNHAVSITSMLSDDNGQANTVMTVGDKVGGYGVSAFSENDAAEFLINSPVLFSATGNVGSAATIAQVSGDAQSGGVNTQLGVPMTVVVRDVGGNPVAGVTISFSITSNPPGATGQTLSSGGSTSDINGQASTFLTLGSVAGTYTVNAASTGLQGSPITFTATATGVTTGAATFLVMTSGNNQNGAVQQALGSPFVVTVTDAGGNPVSGHLVQFAIASAPFGAAGQSLSATIVSTNTAGQASTLLTLGNLGGTYTVTATAPGLSGSPATFTASATATSVETVAGLIPTEFQLFQNYPNPFNPSTRIRFGIPEESNVKVMVFNMLGNPVAEILSEDLRAGMFEVIWKADDFASGTYMVRMQAIGVNSAKVYTSAKKVVLLK